MSDDLISRKDLLGTEQLLMTDVVKNNPIARYILQQVLYDIENTPIAYDVDKVIEQLEELRQNEIKLLCEHESDIKDMQAIRGHNVLQDAIKFVKSGGVADE